MVKGYAEVTSCVKGCVSSIRFDLLASWLPMSLDIKGSIPYIIILIIIIILGTEINFKRFAFNSNETVYAKILRAVCEVKVFQRKD